MNKRDQVIQALACMPNLMLNGTVTIQDVINEVKKPDVVRCKDCKHGGCRTQNLDGSIFRVVCKKHGTKKNELWMDADWFCADGVASDE